MVSLNGNTADVSFLAALIKRLETATNKIEAIALKNPSKMKYFSDDPEKAASNASVQLDLLIEAYLNHSNAIHETVGAHALLIKEGILESLTPDLPNQNKISDCISRVQTFKGPREYDPLLRIAAEFISTFSWPWSTTGEIVTLFKGARESAEYYRNRALKQVKEGGIPGVDSEKMALWCTSLFDLFEAFKKVAINRAFSSKEVSPPLEDSQMASPACVQQVAVAANDKVEQNAETKLERPLIELRGESKWIVERQKNNQNISFPAPIDTNHSVYLFECGDSILNLEHSKLTMASIDQCSRVGMAVKSVISAIEIVRSKDIQIQVFGFCPTINIDSSECVQVYLSKECVEGGAQLITSNSFSVNVLVQENPDDENSEWIEKPIPEQFVSIIDKNKLEIKTTPSSHI